jgi:hypothetical protein
MVGVAGTAEVTGAEVAGLETGGVPELFPLLQPVMIEAVINRTTTGIKAFFNLFPPRFTPEIIFEYSENQDTPSKKDLAFYMNLPLRRGNNN